MELIDLTRAAALLAEAEDILIVTHVRPDGDTAGSGCALCLGMRALGKRAYLVPNPPPKRYEPYMVPYFAPENFVPGFTVAVDIPGSGQFPPGGEHLARQTDLAIDHHGTNSGYARYTFLDADSAATGELVYLLLQALDVPLSTSIAEAVYTAIATDTNGFRTPGTTARTMTIAAALREWGYDPSELTRRLLEAKSAARLRLESALFGAMRFPQPDVCVMLLPASLIRAFGAEETDMDKLSMITMVPEGVRAGVLFRELPDGRWKVSLRTDGSVHAGEILRALGGGGHADAAGAVASGDPTEMEKTILTHFVKK